MENIASSDIVRASVDDIHTAFGISDPRLVYDSVIFRFCPVFICTDASRKILLADYGSFYEYADLERMRRMRRIPVRGAVLKVVKASPVNRLVRGGRSDDGTNRT